MGETVQLLGFPEYRGQAEALADRLGLARGEVQIHHFPDGESRLRLPERLPATVVLCRSLYDPNPKLVELLLAAAGARELGAERCFLVAPYLCYMRQDKAFHPGEVVSQRIVGRLLASHFDGVVTVDPHLHRVHRLSDAIPVPRALSLTATGPMGHFLADRVQDPLLLGPDEESAQWVAAIAGHRGLDYRVAKKQRLGDREVRVTLPAGAYGGRNVVLVDDVASTGRTLEAAARALQPHAPASVSALVTHALFLGDALDRLRSAGVTAVWSCDTIPHGSNAISLAGLLGEGVRQLLG
ncbi:MAG TPA: ribose-phosphate diphosphokinase [Sedimenticola sp.]|nr:ribose-phosphate diphosphokinase [Sedimenticola sp.]